jgi:probable HAF family extracellular repeat protein
MHFDRYAGVVTLGILTTASIVAAPPKYTATKLPLAPNAVASSVSSINLSNVIVGYSKYSDGTTVATRWDANGVKALGSFGGKNCQATSIADTGEIVGASEDTQGKTRPFLYKGGKMYDLGGLYPDSAWATATGISSRGVTIGMASVSAQGPNHAVYWDANGIHDMGAQKKGSYSWATCISASGRIGGFGDTGDRFTNSSFIWFNGRFKSLLGTTTASYVWGINNRGHVVGWYPDYGGNGQHLSFLYNGDQFLGMGLGDGGDCEPLRINQSDLAVGRCDRQIPGFTQFQKRAFVAIPQQNTCSTYDLNDQLTAPIEHPLTAATGITNKGFIIANDDFGNSYLLKPVK